MKLNLTISALVPFAPFASGDYLEMIREADKLGYKQWNSTSRSKMIDIDAGPYPP